MFSMEKVRRIFMELGEASIVARKYTRSQVDEMYHTVFGIYPEASGTKLSLTTQIYEALQN